MQGIIFKKDGDKTKVFLYNKVDPDLKLIPKSFVESGAKDSVYLTKFMSDYLDKHPK